MASHAYSTIPARSTTRRGWLGHAAGAAFAAVGSYLTVRNPEPAAAPDLSDGMAIMRIGGRTVLVDTADFACTSGSEQVCMHFDGRLTIEPAWAETFMKSAPERTALGAFKVVQPGIRERPYVRVIGRVVGERGLAL